MKAQTTMAQLQEELTAAATQKKAFLAQMERIIPWSEWEGMIQPHYYKGERGKKPYPIDLMLRIHVLQNLYSLSDMAVCDQVIDSRAFSDFCGVSASREVPDGDTVGRFREILVRHGLQERFFAQVVELLEARGLILRKGTIVDSTVIAAPSRTDNEKRERDPEAASTKKGSGWHFGFKAHVGVDSESGLAHTVVVTPANKSDVEMTSQLLSGHEETVHGDAGYIGADKRPDAWERNKSGKKIKYTINRRPSQSKNNSPQSQAQIRRWERKKSSVRAKVEHIFAVIKGTFGWRKTRYRGLLKQDCKLNMLFALANLLMADRKTKPVSA